MSKIDITKQEAWKIIDAILAYKKDYALTVSVEKTLNNIVQKLQSTIN